MSLLLYLFMITYPPVRSERLINEQSPDSKMLFQVFSRLARRHATTHFLRLPSRYAEDMPSTALPAVLAYRRGVLIANLVHFVDELAPGTAITVSSVESILSKYVPLYTI